MVAVVCGHGKPTSGRIRDALLGHVAPGSTIVHDREKSHRALVRGVGGAEEPYRADSRDPACLEGMEMVDSLCSWIKRRLRRFPGMRPEHLQDYLDWCVNLFRVKRDNERWPKLERVVRRLVMTDASYRRSRGQSRHPFGLLVDCSFNRCHDGPHDSIHETDASGGRREASCQAFPEVRPGSGSHQWRRGDQRTSPESVANSSHNIRYVILNK